MNLDFAVWGRGGERGLPGYCQYCASNNNKFNIGSDAAAGAGAGNQCSEPCFSTRVLFRTFAINTQILNRDFLPDIILPALEIDKICRPTDTELQLPIPSSESDLCEVLSNQWEGLMSRVIYTCPMWPAEIRFWSKKFAELASPCSYI